MALKACSDVTAGAASCVAVAAPAQLEDTHTHTQLPSQEVVLKVRTDEHSAERESTAKVKSNERARLALQLEPSGRETKREKKQNGRLMASKSKSPIPNKVLASAATLRLCHPSSISESITPLRHDSGNKRSAPARDGPKHQSFFLEMESDVRFLLDDYRREKKTGWKSKGSGRPWILDFE